MFLFLALSGMNNFSFKQSIEVQNFTNVIKMEILKLCITIYRSKYKNKINKQGEEEQG